MPLYVSDDLMTPETKNVFILFAMFLAVGRLNFPVALSAFEYFSVIFLLRSVVLILYWPVGLINFLLLWFFRSCGLKIIV